MPPSLMRLKVLLPFEVFIDLADVSRVVAETHEGSFGLLPRRLDCVATLVPGILTYETAAGGETFLAVDEGVLIKTGLDVRVSVRRALAGSNLKDLRDSVKHEYLTLNQEEQSIRTVMAKMEAAFIRRSAVLRG